MIPVKVAFQGGGAKLVTLIAAADALRDLANEGTIKIEVIAGASAGSLAACMLATDMPFDRQIEIIRKSGPTLLKELGNAKGATPNRLVQIIQGKPLLKEAALRQLIKNLFYGDGQKSITLNDLKIPVHITLSDVHSRKKDIASRENDRELADILADSCALPFILRSHLNQSNFIDGGISSNLPADVIIDASPPEAVPIAFRFKSSNVVKKPSNFIEYAAAIISTAIDASVEQSAASVSQNGGYVCELPDHFDMLDFPSALNMGLHPEHYKTTKSYVLNDIARALKPYQERKARERLISRSRTQSQTIFFAHLAQMNAFPFKITDNTTIVFGFSLYEEGDGRRSQHDHIYQSYCATSDNDIVALRMGIPFGATPLQDTESCLVYDNANNELVTHQILVEEDDPKGRYGKVSYILVYLDKPASPAAMPLTVTYRTVLPNCMSGLLEGKPEWIKARTGEFGDGSTENHVLLVPDFFRDVVVEDLMGGIGQLSSDREAKARHGVGNRWEPGKTMSAADFTALWAKTKIAKPLGFKAFGLQAKSVPSDHFSGALFTTNEPQPR